MAVERLQSNSVIAEWDSETQELVVTFLANGQDYTHSGFPQAEWDAWVKSQSKGRFYVERVRGLY